MPAAAFILALLIHPIGSPAGVVPTQTPPKAPASDSTESQADIAARSLDGNTTITWAELDELILARRAMSKDGRESLRHLAQTKLLDVLGKQNGLTLSDAEVETQLGEIKRQIVASGEKGGFEGFLKDKHVTLVEFMRLLRLGSVQETLTRRTLGLKDSEKVTGEQQQMWMDDALQKRNYQEFNPPWADGIVAQCADVVIKQDEFFDYLHLRLPEDALKEDCWQLLTVKRMKSRMPDLAPERLAKAVEEELQRRREETKHDPRYKGVSYESLLTTQGVLADRMNRDPAVQIAALTKLWVERSYDDASLQRVYKDERDLFDGGYGAAVDTSMIFLRAAAFKNEFNPRTFIEADQMLRDMRGRIRSIEDFHKIAKEASEDAQTKDQSGAVGYVTAHVAKVPAEVLAEIAKAIATDASASADASMVGPIHAPNGSVLLWFGLRRPAPGWEVMSQHVKAELRRRFVEDVLPKTAVVIDF